MIRRPLVPVRNLPSSPACAAWIVVSSLIALLGCSSGPAVDPADVVLQNGRIVTVAEDGAEAQAIALRGDRIAALGTSEEIAAYIGPETEVIELDGRLVVPGFIEGHGHFLSLGTALSVLDLTTANTWDDIVAQVEAAVQEAEPGEWILGRGWHQEKWSSPPEPAVEGNPVHDALSAVSPDNPVLLGHASGHAAFANAKAMEVAGMDGDTPNPDGGEIVKDAAGSPTGLLRETAQRLVRAAVQDGGGDGGVDPRRKLTELAGREALAHGVTSFHDAGVSFDDIAFFQQLESEGALPIRLYPMVRYADNDELEQRLDGVRSEAEGNDFLVVRSIKRQIDGALGAHGAWLLEPYEDLPSSVGLVLETPEDIRRTAEIAVEKGFQVNTHAIGDRANREVLDIYADVLGEAGAEARWRIEHAQHLHPDDVARFAEVGVIASMQGVHCTSDAPWVFKRLGAERAESGAYLWRSLIDSGVVINNGTDVPVEPIDPIASYYASVGRITADGEAFFPDQAMTRMEALRSYTINNAYAAFEEDLKGSLEVGKLADLVVLSGDILEIPVEQIPDVVVDVTVLGGEVVYRR